MSKNGQELIDAAIKGDLEKIKQLLNDKNNNVDINYQDPKHGSTAILYAAQNGHLNVVQYLLEKDHPKADIKIVSNSKDSIFKFAVESGNLDLVKYLLENFRIYFNHEIFWSIFYKLGHIMQDELINYFSSIFPEYNKNNEVSLLCASMKGDIDKVRKILFDKETDVNLKLGPRKNTALITAAELGHLNLVIFLLENKNLHVDLNALNEEDYSALSVAIWQDHFDIIYYLVKHHKPNPRLISDKFKTTVLHKTANVLTTTSDTIRLLCEEFPELVKEVNDEGWNLLHVYAKNNCTIQIKYILNALKLDINAKSKVNDTPLILAAYHGHLDAVKALVEGDSSLDVHMLGEQGMSAIHWASSLGHLPVVSYLLSKFPELINFKDKVYKNALTFAAQYERDDVVRYLLEKGSKFAGLWGWETLSLFLKKGSNIKLDDEKLKILIAAEKLLDIAAGKLSESPNAYLSILGKSVNARNADGNTALHLALMQKEPNISLIIRLLDAQENIDILNDTGVSCRTLLSKIDDPILKIRSENIKLNTENSKLKDELVKLKEENDKNKNKLVEKDSELEEFKKLLFKMEVELEQFKKESDQVKSEKSKENTTQNNTSQNKDLKSSFIAQVLELNGIKKKFEKEDAQNIANLAWVFASQGSNFNSDQASNKETRVHKI